MIPTRTSGAKSRDSWAQIALRRPENHVKHVIGTTQRSQPLGSVGWQTGRRVSRRISRVKSTPTSETYRTALWG
jgi:hypothetical protein